MKSTLIINSGEYPENASICQKICEELVSKGHCCECIDMNNPDLQLHEKFYAIENAKPDLIITFDFAGFECRNGMGDVSFNRIPCRMAHLILHESENRVIQPDEIFNYSMYFFAATESYGKQIAENESVAHYQVLPELMDLKPESKNDSASIAMILQRIWDITEMSLDFTECRLL